MMSGSLIKSISDHAAWEAAQEGKYPLTIWSANDARGIPFLGDYCPPGWRRATWADITDAGHSRPRNVWHDAPDEEVTFMVDASGFGSDHEPALTGDQFGSYLMQTPGYGWAIRESGQFQVVVGAYVRDASAPGIAAPEPEPCDDCGAIHGPMDECEECEHEWEVTDEADGVICGGMAHVYVTRCRICGEEGPDDYQPDDDYEPPIPVTEGQEALWGGV